MTRKVLNRLVVMLCVMVMSLAAKAQVAQYLVVTDLDDATVAFAIAEAPVVTCHDGILEVTAPSQTFALALSEVKNYHFAETNPQTDIDEVAAPDSKPLIEAGHARFENLPEGTVVNIFTIDGRRAGSVTATDGTADIDLSGLGTGIYILATPKASYKIINR